MYLQIAFWSAQVYIYICTLPMYGSVLKIGAFTRSRMSALGWPWLDWCASSPWLWRARQRNTTKQCKAWTAHSALCLVPLESRFWMLKAVPALESRACHFDLLQCSPALHCCCRGAPPQPFLCGQESDVERSSSRKNMEPVLTLCNEVGWQVSCSGLHVTRHR